MARGRRPKGRAAPAPPPAPPPAPARGLGLARIVGRIAAFLEAGGGRLLRLVAEALLRGLARARWGVVEAAGHGDGGLEDQRDAAHDDDKLRAEDKFGDDSCGITGREAPSSATAAALVQEVEEDEPADESAASGVKKATALAPLGQEDAAEESPAAGVKNATAPAPLVEEDGLGEDRTAGAANNAGVKNSTVKNVATAAKNDATTGNAGAAAKNAGADAALKNATTVVEAKKPKTKSKPPPPLPRPRGPRPAPPRPRPPPPDPFEGGYNIAQLYREREYCDDEVALAYAIFCWKRKVELTDKKGMEVCDICYFHEGDVKSFEKKKKLDKHYMERHGGGFVCESTGCMVRCETLREAGLHRYYLHEQSSRDWWKYLLQKHGMDV